MSFENKYPYTDFHELNLDWFLTKFHSLLQEWAELAADNAEFKQTMTQRFNTLDHTVQEFIRFVNNYFDNLDVQQEINNKLNAMVADGTLETLIQPMFDQLVTSVTSSISNQNSRISVLENRMDTFASLPDGSTAGEAELEDIRIGANGITYASAGSAVRSQYRILDNLIQFASDNNVITMTSGYFIKTNTPPVDINTPSIAANMKYAVVACSEGDKFIINGQGASQADTFCFIDASGNKLWCPQTSYTASNLEVEAPANSVYLVLNDRTANSTPSYVSYALKNRTVMKDGTEQVKTKNIEGMKATAATARTGNIFDKATLLWNGYYPVISGNYIAKSENANYKTYYIPIEEGLSYNFTFVRFGVSVRSDLQTVTSSLDQNTTLVNMNNTGTKYYVFSFNINDYDPLTYVVTRNDIVYEIPANWDINHNIISKDNIDIVEGTLSDGEKLVINNKSVVKDGQIFVFKGVLSSFNKLSLQFKYSGNTANYIEVDSTALVVKNDSGTATTRLHGLTIANDITLLLKLIDSKAYITIISNGESFSDDFTWEWQGASALNPQILSTNTTCTYANFTVVYKSVDRKIWIFGDSYVSFNNPARWPYYLVQDEFSNSSLINGSSGGSSTVSKNSLSGLLNYGTPLLAVFATGMNDGSDTDEDHPSSNWSTNKDEFISLCNNENVEPVFCTIPSVPSISNEGKNKWIRNSGYRYIDFAKAVGAQSDGTWYTGMLSPDNVHPSIAGAKALYSQVLIDLPEVMK